MKDEINEKILDVDDKFTNKEEIEYPLETDLVNIKVLNNNTRLLDEKKVNVSDIGSNLQGVAKETSEYNIENKIKQVENDIKHIKDSLGKGNLVIKSIQILRGTLSTPGNTSETRTISSVNKEKTILIVDAMGFSTNSANSSEIYPYSAYAYMQSNNSVTVVSIGHDFIAGQWNKTVKYNIQVIEFY